MWIKTYLLVLGNIGNTDIVNHLRLVAIGPSYLLSSYKPSSLSSSPPE